MPVENPLPCDEGTILPMNAPSTNQANEYEVLSKYYDLEYDQFDDDLPLYDLFARRADGSILELGCGTGRILESLSSLNFPLTGIDSSAAMLRLADERVGGLASLVHMDMTELESARLPNAPFSMAFISINTFLHLPDIQSQLATLAGVRKNVNTDGLLLLDIFSPDVQFFETLASQVQHEFTFRFDDGSRLDKWISRTHDQASQTIENDILFDLTSPDGTVKRTYDHYTTRYVYYFEMEHLLARTGWIIENVYGDYDLSGYDSASERMVIVAVPEH